MNFETLEHLWRSNGNDLSKTAEAYLLEDMMRTLKSRRTQFRTAMTMIGAALLAWSAAIGFAVVRGSVFEASREWGMFGLLAVCWVAYVAIITQYGQHLRRYPHANASMPEALATLLDENRTAQKRARLMLAALVVFLITIAVALGQLHEVGKMEPRHIQQFCVLMGGALGLSVLFNGLRYFRVLKPEGARLKRLLDGYSE